MYCVDKLCVAGDSKAMMTAEHTRVEHSVEPRLSPISNALHIHINFMANDVRGVSGGVFADEKHWVRS